jgi:hypothetical protein
MTVKIQFRRSDWLLLDRDSVRLVSLRKDKAVHDDRTWNFFAILFFILSDGSCPVGSLTYGIWYTTIANEGVSDAKPRPLETIVK